MGCNCECTRPVSRGPYLTNNGYWCKDNKADGRILTMSKWVNRDGLTQRNVQCCCYSEARSGPDAKCNSDYWIKHSKAEGPNKLTIATRLSHHSKCQDALEWASESVANPTTIISLSRKWDFFSTHEKVRPGNAWTVAVISLFAAQERRPEPTQVVKPLKLL